MAFGITRAELEQWKAQVRSGEIAYITHYWYDPKFPEMSTITKVGCADIQKLTSWCEQNGLNPKYIHHRYPYPHFDLIGPKQKEILYREQLWDQIKRFNL